MPTAVSGARGTANVTQSLRKEDFSDHILLLQPDQSPLTVLSKRLNKKPTHNPVFKWAEDDIDPRFSATAASVLAGATSFAVTAGQGSYFKANDLVRVPRTGEVLKVTSVSTDTLTVTRGIGAGGTGVAMNASEELLVLGSAKAEGATADTARTFNPTVVSNYTQIFRRPVEETETWIHSDQYVSDNDWDYQVRKAGIDHAKDIEETFINGKASEDTTGSQPVRTTGGALSFVTSNLTAAGGTLSEASFFAALRPAFRYGSKTKTGLASGLVVDVLNTYARSKTQVTSPSQDTYGLQVIKYQSPHGTLNLVTHWLLEGSTLGGYMLILDMAQVQYRYLANSKGSRDTFLKDNIQAPDADTRKAEFITEAGLQFGLEKTHALITGVTG